MFVIGAHLSKREGYLSMAMEADGLGANTFQYFSRCLLYTSDAADD